MELPKEFFTPQSTTTLTGAASITYVVASTIQQAFKFNPRWLALLIAIAVAQVGVWYVKGGVSEYLFGLLNGCLIYLTAVGMSAVSDKSSSRGARRDLFAAPEQRGFFSSWW